MARWYKRQVSTPWGIALLGFFLVAVVLLIPYLGQIQGLQGQAETLGMSSP